MRKYLNYDFIFSKLTIPLFGDGFLVKLEKRMDTRCGGKISTAAAAQTGGRGAAFLPEVK